jgi:uncharacterized protein YpmS
MKTEITLKSIYTLLSGFISKQEVVNHELLQFKSQQEAFNSKQEGFNSRQETFSSKQESFNSRIEDRLDRFQEEEKANHNLSHRMIMQSFEAIRDVRADIDAERQPWKAKR